MPDASRDGRQLIGDLMMVGAGAAWGATTLVIKGSALRGAPAEKVLAYQLAVSIPMLAAGALLMGERMTAVPSAFALGWLAYQTFWVVSLTFTIWFAMVQRYSASRLSAFTFLTPLFGVASGHFVLGEPISWAFGLAVALVIAGLVLVNRPKDELWPTSPCKGEVDARTGGWGSLPVDPHPNPPLSRGGSPAGACGRG